MYLSPIKKILQESCIFLTKISSHKATRVFVLLSFLYEIANKRSQLAIDYSSFYHHCLNYKVLSLLQYFFQKLYLFPNISLYTFLGVIYQEGTEQNCCNNLCSIPGFALVLVMVV